MKSLAILGHISPTDYDHMFDGSHYGWMVLWLFIMVIVFTAVVVAAARLIGKSPTSSSKPLDIAKERYARGEITKEGFDQIKNDLK